MDADLVQSVLDTVDEYLSQREDAPASGPELIEEEPQAEQSAQIEHSAELPAPQDSSLELSPAEVPTVEEQQDPTPEEQDGIQYPDDRTKEEGRLPEQEDGTVEEATLQTQEADPTGEVQGVELPEDKTQQQGALEVPQVQMPDDELLEPSEDQTSEASPLEVHEPEMGEHRAVGADIEPEPDLTIQHSLESLRWQFAEQMQELEKTIIQRVEESESKLGFRQRF